MSQGKGMLRADVDDSLLGCSLRRTGLHFRSYDGLEHHLRLCLQHARQSGNQLPRATMTVLCMACHCAAPTSQSRPVPVSASAARLHAHGTLRKGRLRHRCQGNRRCLLLSCSSSYCLRQHLYCEDLRICAHRFVYHLIIYVHRIDMFVHHLSLCVDCINIAHPALPPPRLLLLRPWWEVA